ncbi:dephospho-CoA kinase [Xanthobacter tagetidis]|uniref:Dephospho-CoA kinase n=1 Tax=Xanthobacter tagetidis TaxID=60216 RepID=A0A3L7A6K2_9HYPH|nr:dephospho-CoA kinase [Xanthobacter tagetidis]RLP75480.1 dephospho-CoA kinase [Xanthobacter tagetidis]
MWILGLTGSIGMGKSATAAMFRAMGVPVHDADAAVHRLYEGAAVAPVEAAFPGVTRDGAIDRPALSARVLNDADAMKRLEAIVHPLVRAEETAFLDAARRAGARLAVLDIPLLFETGGAARVDAIAVVSAPIAVQRARVLDRPGMTQARFEAILARQVPDAEKRRRAHFVIDTGRGFEAARRQVAGVVRALGGPGRRA